MKTFLKKSLVVAAILSAANIIGMMLVYAQETATFTTASIVPHSGAELHSIESYSDAQLTQLINDLSATPLIWPTNTPNRGANEYWSLAHPNWPPLPTAGNTPFWNLTPSYAASSMSSMSADSTASSFLLLDDIDFPPSPGGTNSDGGTNVYNVQPMGLTIDTNGLYLQVPTNSLATSGYFTVNVMNTIIGYSYDILTKPDLLSPSWTTSLTTNAVANITQVQVPMSSTNLFVWARESSNSPTFYISEPPLSQNVEDGDSVTFGVDTSGNTNLTYQWMLNGIDIDGATNSTYTINNVQDGDAGDYAVTISDGTNSLTTTSGQLTTDSSNSFGYTQTGDYNLVPILGSRQDYTFKSGNTYYISSATTFYGKTTIEGGAVIKPDWYYGGSIQIMGTLDCKTEPYFPAILTSVDDDSVGEYLGFSQQDGAPFTAENGIPYLDMTYAESNSISNLRICFADEGVTTPVDSRKLDVWDCQFVECNYGIINLVAGTGADDSLHNVLFAGCGAAIGASSNSIAIDGEQVTADVSDFCAANATPSSIALTNSIYWGDTLTASSLSTVNVFQNPNGTNFVSEGYGGYYLTANSPLHNAGTANISSRLQTELQRKTTYAPVPIAVNTTITGDLTLSPQAQRYTNGSPDIGYYYDALDYSVANLTLAGGNLTILPNTAIAVRNEYDSTNDSYSVEGFFVRQGSVITSHGTPDKPNIFTAEKMVQETPETDFAAYRINQGWWFEGITFVTDSEPDDQNSPAAVYNFRFSKFYLPVGDYHFWSGYDEYGDYSFEVSPDSSMYLSLQDCQIHGGRINLGNPDQNYYLATQVYPSGALHWMNNSFENTAISLDPTYYRANGVVNCDMQLLAYNNLFKGGSWLLLEPFPASAGNWVFENNLFDKVDFLQDTNQPLNFDHNGYWQLQPSELLYGSSAGELAVSTGGTDGGDEVTLSNAPPYQVGTFGKFYLPDTTPLYGAGSTNAAGMGLYQYTTRLDQTKEGDETAGHMVNIGVHYVAANGDTPKDTDGDGVPDYVEDANGNGIVDFNTAENVNETDWQNPMTDGVTNDAYNAAYDDIDLSGDGLVGRIKKALGMNPFDTSNPLTLTQVITGQEPDIVTFEVPISYNSLTNIGSLYLLVDENQGGEFQSYSRATDGNCLLTWNTTFDSPGQHYLQAQLNLNGQIEGGDTPAPTVLAAIGNLDFYQSTNVCQFDPSFSSFDDSGATLYAITPTCSNADYTIELQTPSGQHIKTITNSTSNGIIAEHWDLTDDNGNLVTNDAVKAVFDVTLLDPGAGISTFWLHRTASGLGTDGKFTVAYAWDVPSQAQSDGTMWNAILGGVVNPLLTPVTAGGGFSDNYNSDFDRYTGDNSPGDPGSPGYISTQIPDVANLVLTNLPNINTMNFYWDGHGSPTTLGDGNRQQVAIGLGQVASSLKNKFDPENGDWSQHPYRFVFLNCCETADNVGWAHAFGIPKRISKEALAAGTKPQAFVGWNGSPRAAISDDDWNNEAETYAVFFNAWMSGYSLLDCINIASLHNPYGDGSVILNLPLGTRFNLLQNWYGLRGWNHFNIQIYGYAGITRFGYDDGY